MSAGQTFKTFLTATFGTVSAFALSLALTTPSNAVTKFQKSAFTAFSLSDCQVVASQSDAAAYMCPGLPGFDVYLAEHDGRTYLSAGPNPQHTAAATQSLELPNTPFPARGRRATLEWRFVIRDGHKVPYALIVRTFTRPKVSRVPFKPHGEFLTVTLIQGTQACHAATIDALTNPDAIVQARRFADQHASAPVCALPPQTLGLPSNSPM